MKNTKFFINANKEIVDQYYKNSAIYIHATGLGIDPKINPEKCEHYGISTFEAILNGCIPIVSANGGPYLQIKDKRWAEAASTIDGINSDEKLSKTEMFQIKD